MLVGSVKILNALISVAEQAEAPNAKKYKHGQR
jgi:hypothetical protein